MTEQHRQSFVERLKESVQDKGLLPGVLGALHETARISRVENHPHHPGCTKSKDIVVDAEEYAYSVDPRLSGFYAYKETHCEECGAVKIIDPFNRKGKQDRKMR